MVWKMQTDFELIYCKFSLQSMVLTARGVIKIIFQTIAFHSQHMIVTENNSPVTYRLVQSLCDFSEQRAGEIFRIMADFA